MPVRLFRYSQISWSNIHCSSFHNCKMADKLIKKRSSMKAKLTYFTNYLNNLENSDRLSELQVLELESRFSKFEQLYDEFNALQTEIELLSDNPDDAYADRFKFEENYHNLVATARKVISAEQEQRQHDKASAGSVSGSEVTGGTKNNFIRLPKIDLPRFDGSYQCWLEYRDTFLSLIHNNNNIDNINKFHYLRASLKGQAAEIIKNIDFRNDNYGLAWDLLCERYDNSRLLINNHVKALFNAEPITNESSTALRRLVDVTNKNIRALTLLKEPTRDTLIIYLMTSKLDNTTNRDWEEYRNSLDNSPTLLQFCTFMNNKADLLETLEEHKKLDKVQPSSSNKSKSFIVTSQKQETNNNEKDKNKIICPMCSQNHYLYSCVAFKQLTIEERVQKAKEFKVCMNCLRVGHTEKRCRFTRCKYCKNRHNTLLHLDQPETQVPKDPMPSTSSNNVSLSADIQPTSQKHVLLSTAVVKVVGDKGERYNARVLLDSGSTANFITAKLCSDLGLSRVGTTSRVTGINSLTSNSTHSCNLTIESTYEYYSFNITCLILPEITRRLPASYINSENIPIPAGLVLADPSFNIPSDIDILLGAELFWEVIQANHINLGKNLPKLCESKLGWLISGTVPAILHKQTHVCNFSETIASPDLNKFWELDTISPKHCLSMEERACEESFKSKTVRDSNGQFVVTMPLKASPSVLGDSYAMAKRRFLSLEKRFERDPIYKSMYIDFIQEYETLGHMTEDSDLPVSDRNNISYYLPHHGVLRESSKTTKLRTVFDASAKSTSGLSLNDIQYVGPTVQNDLFSILLRFRQHKYVISGDIEKMYRAVKLNPSQRSLQRIIFRKDPSEPLKSYTLNTVTYGTASAPYLATKCLVSLAEATDNQQVKSSIQRDFYVDDLLSGSDTINGAIELCQNVKTILSSAKFNLRKWKSNSTKILKEIVDIEDDSCLDLDLSNNYTSKTLGLLWICKSDVLSFSINIDIHKRITKRHILSIISQIFDPLGLIGPCVVQAKIVMQKLWVNKCDWDDEVPQDIADQWLKCIDALEHLNSLNIHRWVSCDNCINNEIHTFTDSSERAYGACVYIRSTDRNNAVTVRLLTSKSRIAPIKPTTMPRLELCGALLGARLCTKVKESLTIPVSRCVFWCDSTIVLSWLSAPSTQLKPFVRHRVNEIQETTLGSEWNYVPTRDNPADLVSRGVKADHISDSSLWWAGPSFLLQDECLWPKPPNDLSKQDLPELTYFVDQSNNSHIPDNQTLVQQLTHKYSDFNRLQRIMAYIKRYIHNLKSKNNKLTQWLSNQEIQSSLKCIVHNAQLEMFPDEYSILKLGKSLPHKNRLISLSPFLDSDGIIRVGGRLNNSPYDYNVKHPILMCSKHHLTKIMFQNVHRKLLHAGPQLLLANIRQNYWPLGGRNLSRVTVQKCVVCFRHKAQNLQPIMGQLPKSRSNLEFPFLNSSVDYAGPILIADRKGRGCRLIKSYICIFVCLAVKAVHLELVTDLTKEAYMAALNRFVARRGKPRSILSDNGTTFVGSCNQLRRFLQTSNIAYDVAQEGIEFNFVPAYSPHFNGVAEAAVRSTKHHLKRLLKLTHFTYEEMATCLTQIEAILNSRPLTPCSPDPLDFCALTPSHFLIGRSLTSVPHPQMTDRGNISRLERFQRVEYIKQHFWRRFNTEYISLLQQKTKWSTTSDNIKVGSLVLVKDKALPPLCWLLGRVVQVYPGSDGVVRVAELKTKKGTIRRAFNNICPLPLF